MLNKTFHIFLLILILFLLKITLINYLEVHQTKRIVNDVLTENITNYDNKIIGWLKVNNTNIDYPVTQYSDNSYYLNHDLNGNISPSGWIFQDYRSNSALTSKNTIIYGHARISDGTMFGSLYNILKSNWYLNKDNQIITYKNNDKINYYQVFSTYIIPKETYYLKTIFNNDNAYLNYLNTIKSRSYYNYNITLTSKDLILTLTTCYKDNKRLVLHAKLL
jgi:sortase B